MPKIIKIIKKFFTSAKLTLILITAIIIICAAGIFLPAYLFLLFLPASLLLINLAFCLGQCLTSNFHTKIINPRQWGLYLIHIGIILIVAAVAIRYFQGWSSSIKIKEGETISLSDSLSYFGKPLNLRCEKFTIDYNTDGKPKDFSANLVFSSGSSFSPAIVAVNHPAGYSGANFYLTGYGEIPGAAMLIIKRHGLLIGQADLRKQEEIAADDLIIKALRIEEDVKDFGPAVKIQIAKGNRSQNLWIFQNIKQMKKKYPRILQEMPLMNPALFTPYLFSFIMDKDQNYIVLEIRHDPGIPLAAAGAVGLFIGILLILIFGSSARFKRAPSLPGNSDNGKTASGGKDD